MGVLTLTQIQDAVKSGLGNRTDFTDAEYTRYINISVDRITRQENWQELEQSTDLSIPFTSTPATDKILDISALTNWHSIYSFVIEDTSNSRKLIQMSPREFEKAIPLPEQDSTGTPEVYMTWATDTVYLWRVPNEAYTARILWRKWPTALSGANDTSDLDRKDDLIIFLTISFMYALIKELESANKFFGYYQNELKQAVRDAIDTPDLVTTPTWLRGAGSFGPPSHLDPFSRRIN